MKRLFCALGIALIWPTISVRAHTPVCACYDNGDDTILCEGGFSDGSTATGVRMAVLDEAGNVLIEGAMSSNSEFVFTKPKTSFTVLFDGGEGHIIRLPGSDIH